MSPLGKAIRRYLLANEAIAALVGDRVRPGVLAQDDQTFPVLTYQTISAAPDEALDGDCGHENDRLQITVYDRDDDQADELARLARARLLTARGLRTTTDDGDGSPLFITGVSTAGGVRDSSQDSPIDGSDNWIYQSSFDLRFSYNPPGTF